MLGFAKPRRELRSADRPPSREWRDRLARAHALPKLISLPSADQSDTTPFIMDFGSILSTILVGLVVGVIAKLLMPGKDPGGFIVTILLGIAGAFVGTWVGRMFMGANYAAGWIMSIVGAMILLLLYRLLFKRGT
jgi:uncharacterized membrane protein YeaQ/YmgE (transglycosylase-associated protein family)